VPHSRPELRRTPALAAYAFHLQTATNHSLEKYCLFATADAPKDTKLESLVPSGHVVHLVEHAPKKLVGGVRFPTGSCRKLKKGTCGLSSLLLEVNGWVQENGSHPMLPLTRHQCSIHCESSRVAHGASKRR